MQIPMAVLPLRPGGHFNTTWDKADIFVSPSRRLSTSLSTLRFYYIPDRYMQITSKVNLPSQQRNGEQLLQVCIYSLIVGYLLERKK